MAKKQIVEGLNGLLAPTTKATAATAEATTDQGHKVVLSFSVDEKTAENLRYVAYYDRRTQSAVITEALNEYFSRWTPAPQEKPRKL